MRTRSQSHYVRRFSLWLLGQALPETGALRKPARLALISVVVASAAGTLLALSVVGALTGLYFYLVNHGLTPGASLGVVSGVGILAGLVAYFVAQSRLDAIPDALDDLQLFHNKPSDLIGELLNLVVGGFLEGASEKPEKNSLREQLEEKIAELTRKLETMEAELDISDDEVVLEIDTNATPRRKRKS